MAAAGAASFPSGAPQEPTIRLGITVHYLPLPAEDAVLSARSFARQETRRVKLVQELPMQPTEPVLRAVLRSEPARLPDPATLLLFAHGVTAEQAKAVQRSQRSLVLEFAHPRTRAADALRLASTLSEKVARETGGLLWDDATRELFTPDEWRRHRSDGWVDESPDVSRHIAVQVRPSGTAWRAVTLGMSKFGLPDVVVDRYPASAARPVADLIQAFAQAMVEGAVIGRGGEFDLDLRLLRHPDVQARQAARARPGNARPTPLVLVEGTPDADDPPNRLVEIRFDRLPGADAVARLAGLAGGADRLDDSPRRVPQDDDLQRVSAAARARLPAWRSAFVAGLPAGETLQLKSPFAVGDGSTEWMWVEVLSWTGDAIIGVLRTEPRAVPGLAAGQIVNVRQREVGDYLYRRADGTQEGNATGVLLERMQPR